MSEPVQRAAASLVDRARNGDQNAMANLVQIGKNRASNPQAALAYRYAMGYAKSNPPPAVRPAFGTCRACTSFGGLKRTPKEGPEYGRSIVAFVLDMGPSFRDARIAADIVSNVRPIDRSALRFIMSGTPPNVRGVFAFGYRDPLQNPGKAKAENLSPDEMKALQLGYIVGMAKRLQELQLEDTPISHESPRIGWELGE